MFAVVESGSITSLPKGNRGVKIGDYNYPPAAFTHTRERKSRVRRERKRGRTQREQPQQEWYMNTNITYAFGSGKVTGTYGTATAKAHADSTYTNDDKTNNLIPTGKDVGDVKKEGLKTILIRGLKKQAEGILNQTDWYVTRKAEKSTAIPSAITTHRDAVRTKQAEMETAITNAADTPALETLYTRNDSGVRPLGDLPTLE